MTPLRIGLVGYGLGGRYFHAPLLASAPDCEFLGVVTNSPERRREVAAGLGARGLRLLCSSWPAAGADAVTISTPAATHVSSPSRRCGWACGRMRQAVRAGCRFGSPDGLLAGQLAGPADRLPEPPLGFGLPDRARVLWPTACSGSGPSSSRGLSGSRPIPGRPRPAAARCWTSAAIWSIRRWCSRAPPAPCTPRCTPASPAGRMTMLRRAHP